MRFIAAAILFLLLGYYPACAYKKLGHGVYQSDGSDRDTLAAVNAAGDGDTVVIPSGTFAWASGVTIADKSITLTGTAGGGTTIQHNRANPVFGFYPILALRPSPTAGHGNIEVKNLAFVEGPALAGLGHGGRFFIYTERFTTPPVYPNVCLVHDCTFTSNGNVDDQIKWSDNGGVIWNCTFNFTGADIGIGLDRENVDTWESPSTMGTLDTTGLLNTYIEDCTFNNTSRVNVGFCDVSGGARTVVRHCTSINSSFQTHGQETSVYGMRHFECYNCKFQNPDTTIALPCWYLVRGGTFVIYGNTFDQLLYGTTIDLVVEGLRRSATVVSCPTQYPVARQVGQGWSGGPGSYSYPQLPSDGTGYIADPAYIWNNNLQGVNLTDFEPDQCGHNLRTAQFVQSGRDYFVGKPKPGYTPYTYPHPLRNKRGRYP